MIVPRHLISLLLLVASLTVACAQIAPPTPIPSPASAVAAAPTGNPTIAVAPTTVQPTAIPSAAVPTVTLAPSPTTSASVPTPTATAYPVTVTDDAGRSVTFDRAPQRIISLSPGPTESLYALGAGSRIVATDQFSDYPAENKPRAKLNTYPKPNAEEIVSDQPDLVVVLVEGDDFIQLMEARGIKVLKVYPKTFDGALRDLDLLGKVVGAPAQAAILTSTMRERKAAVVAKTKDVPKIPVLYELDATDPTRPYVAGPAGFYGDLIPLAGGKNLFDDLGQPAAQVSSEQIVARNPQIIILGDSLVPFNAQTPAMVKTRTGWSQIDAVKNGKIVELDDALLSRPGPRLIDGLEQLAKLIHPEQFR